MTGYFTGVNRITTLVIVEILEQICATAITLLCLHFWAGNDPGKACQSIVLGSNLGAVVTLSCLVFLRIRERSTASAPIPIRSRLMQAAVPLAVADDVKAGINTLENLMVPKRLALCTQIENPLAAFGLLSGMVFPILMFPACILYALAELLIPELARCAAAGHRTRIRYLTRRSLRIAMLYGLLFGGLEWLLADNLCTAIYRNTQAGQSLRLYALLIPMLYCDAIIDAMNKGLGQQKICVRYNILTALLDVVFLYLLLPEYGMRGYFLSFFVTHLLNFALSLRLLLKVTGHRLPLYIPTLALSATLAAAWAANLLPSPALQAIGFTALLGSLLCLAKVTGKEDIIWFRNLILQQKGGR
jgi:stage V sporulation protein B